MCAMFDLGDNALTDPVDGHFSPSRNGLCAATNRCGTAGSFPHRIVDVFRILPPVPHSCYVA